MKLYTHKKLIEKATAILEVIADAERRIKTREVNLKKYQVFTGLVEKYKQDNENTKLAKARLESYYNNTILKIQETILGDRNINENIDAIETYNTVSAEDLETTVRVLYVTTSKLKAEEKKEYHEFKRTGKGINFDNVNGFRDSGNILASAINLILNYSNGK